MAVELFLGPLVALVLGAKFTVYKQEELVKGQKQDIEKLELMHAEEVRHLNTRLTTLTQRLNAAEDTIDEMNTRLDATAKTIEVIDKQTLEKFVTTLQPVSSALKEIQTYVGLR